MEQVQIDEIFEIEDQIENEIFEIEDQIRDEIKVHHYPGGSSFRIG